MKKTTTPQLIVMQKRRAHQKTGLGLVEIMLAVVVITFGLLGTLNIIDVGRRTSARAIKRISAIELAQMKAAELQMAGYQDLNQRLGSEDSILLPAGSPVPILHSQKFFWQTTLRRNPDSEQLIFDVRVYWRRLGSAAAAGSGEEQMPEDYVELTGILNPKGNA